MNMKKVITCGLLALSILGGIASASNADPQERFGTRTAPQQASSPN
jgi:hypothetical protein